MKQTQAQIYGATQEEYRRAYNKYMCSKRRGNAVTLDMFLNDQKLVRVRLRRNSGKSKPKKYYTIKQRLILALATPKWINIYEILDFYMNCPEDKHVDHIIPLNGENVCGLHVPWNLQYLDPSENRKKSNKT